MDSKRFRSHTGKAFTLWDILCLNLFIYATSFRQRVVKTYYIYGSILLLSGMRCVTSQFSFRRHFLDHIQDKYFGMHCKKISLKGVSLIIIEFKYFIESREESEVWGFFVFSHG